MDDFGNKWGELRKSIKQRWMSFTDDDIQAIGGNKDVLIEMLREKYGYSQLQATQEFERFMEENSIGIAPQSK